ncbi:MAG: tRNA-intron lyase [Candidatus Pacearchaeota archaeon]|nr:tRNA-intron lyase [Candidatus Pacearchaeota archaeon]
MIEAYFTGEKFISTSEEAFSLYEKSRFGEKKDKKIEYSAIEALFLLSIKKLSVFSEKKQLTEESLIKKLRKKDKRIETKLIVYSDLRKRGYIVKTALKYGADFRVYDKGLFPGEEHAKWILFATKEYESISWHEFAAKNRIAHSTKKNLLIAIVDEEGDVSYYEIQWIKP